MIDLTEIFWIKMNKLLKVSRYYNQQSEALNFEHINGFTYFRTNRTFCASYANG